MTKTVAVIGAGPAGLAVENIALGQDHDLWRVNTNDTRREEAFIDETGLVPRAT